MAAFFGAKVRIPFPFLVLLTFCGCSEIEGVKASNEHRKSEELAEKLFSQSQELFKAGGDGWIEPALKAAELGHVVAMVNVAAVLLAKSDCSEVEQGRGLLLRASERGIVIASKRLAELYESGPCVEYSVKESRHWRKKAAMGGDMDSAAAIARWLLSSSDEKDRIEGTAWGLIYVDRIGDERLMSQFFERELRQPLSIYGVAAVERYIDLNNTVGCYPLPRGECHFTKEQVLITADEKELQKGNIVLR